MFGKTMTGFGVIVTLGSAASALAAPPAANPKTDTRPNAGVIAKHAIEAPPGTRSAVGVPDWQGDKKDGLWLWTDDQGAHLRFHDGLVSHRLTGSVCATSVVGVKDIDLEAGDSATIDKRGDCVRVDLAGDASVDGVDFTTTGDLARADFRLNGKPMVVSDIHIGKTAASPDKARFGLRLTP